MNRPTGTVALLGLSHASSLINCSGTVGASSVVHQEHQLIHVYYYVLMNTDLYTLPLCCNRMKRLWLAVDVLV